MVDITIKQGETTLRRSLSAEPLHIGRAPDNGLSLMAEQLSWYHAIVWLEDGVVWVRDLCSTNGTFINDERLRDTGCAGAQDVIRFGSQVTMEIDGALPRADAARFALEDLDQKVRHILQVGTLHVVDAQALSLNLPGALTLAPDGSLSLDIQGSPVPLSLGEVFEVSGGQRLRVVPVKTIRLKTTGAQEEPFPYRLTVRLNGPRGAEAILLDRQTTELHRVSSENRVVLLYLLVKQIRQDLAAGRPPEESGWCEDEDLLVGIWGRNSNSTSGKLAVLTHRLRKELTQAGFDHRFLEKERKILRARLIDVELD